ncbi:MAG: algC [Francisellaceae bacterium]|nr:algC [Francisellaceae bacterium]
MDILAVKEEIIHPEIFRAYDIRGIVDETLSLHAVFKIGQAIGSRVLMTGANEVIIGRDGRLSGPSLFKALSSGIIDTGCNVLDIGLVPTPVLYFASHFLKIKAAVIITGSHNPANYNGLKIIIDNETLYNEGILALYHLILKNQFVKGKGQLRIMDVKLDYIQAVQNKVNISRSLKVVVDCGNGAAGIIIEDLLKSLNCEIIPLFCEIDGNFPNHHPDPAQPENLKTLIETVLQEKADVGIAFDGDGDRMGIVDEQGKIIWSDRLLMLFAKELLNTHPNATIIYDVKCTRHLEKVIKEAGGIPYLWKTGHSFIKAKMKEIGALLAGEMSGHIFFKERWYGFDDGLYTAARLLEILSNTHLPCSQLFKALPESYTTPEIVIPVTETDKFQIIEKLINNKVFTQGKIITIDGIRVELDSGWGLVRASNTSPNLILRFEADSQSSLENIKNYFQEALNLVDNKLKISWPV